MALKQPSERVMSDCLGIRSPTYKAAQAKLNELMAARLDALTALSNTKTPAKPKPDGR